VQRIAQMRKDGLSLYQIAKTLNDEGTRTRYKKEFQAQTVKNVFERMR